MTGHQLTASGQLKVKKDQGHQLIAISQMRNSKGRLEVARGHCRGHRQTIETTVQGVQGVVAQVTKENIEPMTIARSTDECIIYVTFVSCNVTCDIFHIP